MDQSNIETTDLMLNCLKTHWGLESFYPYQKQVIQGIVSGRDTVTVVSTGGGKSLCYQLPAVIQKRTGVVISPLISLMHDQVQGLREMGINSAFINSTLDQRERELVWYEVQQGKLDLLYIAPERLNSRGTIDRLKKLRPAYFVIDEAHCISQWGHDFREAYRRLDRLKKQFPKIAVHAFTATATPAVQKDIIDQLSLEQPVVTVGDVDRENLTYRVKPRKNLKKQILRVLKQHPGEAGIIYCLRRRDVDKISEMIENAGYNVLPYHAGLADDVRHYNQEQFQKEKVDIIVATVAFGMGIDRANIRFVIHAAMPKTMEHYQQETGRAGRDGEPAEAVLFFGGNDYYTWKNLLSDSSHREVMLKKLSNVYSFCYEPFCRHRFLTEYFGQNYGQDSCDSCDYCLGELEMVEQPLVLAQKIISCVARLGERYGSVYTADVLLGSTRSRIKKSGHDRLSTHGLLSDRSQKFIVHMIDQLVGQDYLLKIGEHPVLKLTPKSWRVLRGEETPVLMKTVEKTTGRKTSSKKPAVLEEEERELFEKLRQLRMELATEKNLPAYMIFPDRSLREMATVKPQNLDEFAEINGVGEVKLASYGEQFIELIGNWSEKN